MAVIKKKEPPKISKSHFVKSQSAHDQLVKKADTWLKRKGCIVRLDDRIKANTLSGEAPDNVGWRDGLSVMIECKTSRSDFLADQKKRFRVADKGIGDWRFYLCPEGVIQPDDLPEGWGLLWVVGSKIIEISGVPSNAQWWSKRPFIGDKHEETILLTSALRRIVKAGYMDAIYK